MSTNVTVAQAPFDDARADLILQSSEKEPVHFRVSKFILSMASPIFADMLSIPSPASQSSHDQVQVVTLSEDSGTLDLSLRHIYPLRSPEVAELPQMRMLAEFAHKYQVDALEQDVSRYLMDAIDRDPIGVYVIAITYGYKSVGEKAFRLSLKYPFSRLRSPYLQYAPAQPYEELVMYHAACGEAASAVTTDRSWFLSLGRVGKFIYVFPGFISVDLCGSCTTEDPFTSHNPSRCVSGSGSSGRYLISRSGLLPTTGRGLRGLWNYLHRSAVVLAHHPTADAVTATDFVFKGFKCTSCPSDTRQDMLEFSRVFGIEIEKAVGKVG
jgi:hypothetical protein